MLPLSRIYMDANATTPMLPAVLEAMFPYWGERFGNASAVHAHGRTARGAIDTAREQTADLIQARAAEITFTSGGTESDNLALLGILQPGDHLITTAIEHHAVLLPAEHLAKSGVAITVLPPDRNGIVSAEAVRDAMRPNTRLVSIMLANNETGVLQPISAIAEIARSADALVHTDAVQACGKIPVDVHELGCDLLTVSAHKMHGPQGVGALWVRKGVQLRPLLHGGPQERRRRAGTENVAGIAGLGEAAVRAIAWLRSGGPNELCGLRERLESAILARIPDTTVHGANVPRLPNTSSLQFAEVDAEALLIALDLKGLAVSGGSACQSGAIEPSHVLAAMGLSDAEARSTLRISLSRLNTAAEIDAAVDLLSTAVLRLRTITS